MKITYRVDKPADFIFDYLTDMNKFTSVHPVITKMEKIANNNYKVFETLNFGPIPYSFTYQVTLESDALKNHVTIKATVMKINKISMSFIIIEQKDYSMIEEVIEFQSLLPIKSLLLHIFKKQHAQLFKNINTLTF